jgi:hypothetical protein
VTLGGGAVADEQELVARVRPAAGKAVGLAADEGKRIVAAVAEKPVGSPPAVNDVVAGIAEQAVADSQLTPVAPLLHQAAIAHASGFCPMDSWRIGTQARRV